jgi:two-component system, chemotaxis family, CheB/CheR fusion protein
MSSASSASPARKILVVEDNLDSGRSLVYLLRDMGQRVEFAINGYAAQEIARRFKPEIIILDIGLPDTDGYRLARAWKSDPEMKAAKIIALTAYGTEEHKRRSQDAGIDQHIVKPLDPKRLAELIADKK